MKRLLYLEDLWKFYASQNKNVKFSSRDSDTTIVVHINEPFSFSEQTDDELNLYAPIRLCHIDKNANNSSISEKAMKDAMSTAYEMPLLAYIYPDPDNEEQYTFAGHEFYVDDNNEMVYEEAPVGVISTKQKLELVYDAESDKTYLDGLAKVWRTYTKAAEILEREKKFSVSVEIAVDDLAYSAKDKVLVINAFRFMGVTILGKSRTDGSEIKPGMTGSNISIEDFSEKNNSIFSQNDKVIEMLSALNEKIDNLNIDKNFRKEEENLVKKEFKETPEAEVKDTPAEVFEDDPKKKKKVDDDDVAPVDPDDGGDESGDDDPKDDKPTDDNPKDDDPKDDNQNTDDNPTGGDNSAEETPEGENESHGSEDDESGTGNEGDNGEDVNYYSATVTRGDLTKTFAISLEDKQMAILELVNATYGEVDDDWYNVIVYEEPRKEVVFYSWWSGNAYRQSYKVKKNEYTLEGERVPVHALYVTDDEENVIESMRSNYSAIETELAQYKAEPEKEAVLAEECYSQIKDTDAYKALAEKDAHFSMSVDEVRAELDKQLLEYAKGHEIKFSSKEPEKKQVGMKLFGNPSKKTGKTGRYGGLFSK